MIAVFPYRFGGEPWAFAGEWPAGAIERIRAADAVPSPGHLRALAEIDHPLARALLLYDLHRGIAGERFGGAFADDPGGDVVRAAALAALSDPAIANVSEAEACAIRDRGRVSAAEGDYVRMTAAFALDSCAREQDVPVLTGLLDRSWDEPLDDVMSVRSLALSALRRLDAEAPGLLARTGLLARLAAIATDDPVDEVRRRALQVLAERAWGPETEALFVGVARGPAGPDAWLAAAYLLAEDRGRYALVAEDLASRTSPPEGYDEAHLAFTQEMRASEGLAAMRGGQGEPAFVHAPGPLVAFGPEGEPPGVALAPIAALARRVWRNDADTPSALLALRDTDHPAARLAALAYLAGRGSPSHPALSRELALAALADPPLDEIEAEEMAGRARAEAPDLARAEGRDAKNHEMALSVLFDAGETGDHARVLPFLARPGALRDRALTTLYGLAERLGTDASWEPVFEACYALTRRPHEEDTRRRSARLLRFHAAERAADHLEELARTAPQSVAHTAALALMRRDPARWLPTARQALARGDTTEDSCELASAVEAASSG